MWKLFSDLKDGICIESSSSRIKEAFKGITKLENVEYFNQESHINDLKNLFEEKKCRPWAIKDQAYKCENEIRAIIIKEEDIQQDDNFTKSQIDLTKFIERVIVAPNSDDDQVECVKCILKKNGFSNVTVEKSKILDPIPEIIVSPLIT